MSRPPFNIWLLLRAATIWRCIGTALLLAAGFFVNAAAAVSLELKLAREKIYPGESVPVTVTLRVSDVRVRNIGYPRLAAPAGGSVAFAPPVQDADASDPNVALYRFSGRISSITPGQLAVGPASLDLEIIEAAKGSDAFFGAIEPRPQSLVTAPVTLTVLPLPADRPASFSGAIGSFSMKATSSPETPSPGDPLTITTTISGAGTLNSARCPRIAGDNLRSYPPTVRNKDKGLVCEQVVIPAAAGHLPPVVWSYFDPEPGRYCTLRQNLPDVAPSSGRNAATTAPVPPASSSPSHVQGASALMLLIALIGLTVAICMTLSLRRHAVIIPSGERAVAVPPSIKQSLARLEQSLIDGDVEKFYTVLFRLLQELVGVEGNISPAAVTGLQPPPPDTPSNQSVALTHLFTRCDRIRFGRFVPREEEMRADLSLMQSVLHPDHLPR